jgi:hypothetical protein
MEYELESIAYDTDEFISSMLTKHKIDPLILSSVILARLMLANEYVGSDQDFKKLAANVSVREKKKRDINIH